MSSTTKAKKKNNTNTTESGSGTDPQNAADTNTILNVAFGNSTGNASDTTTHTPLPSHVGDPSNTSTSNANALNGQGLPPLPPLNFNFDVAPPLANFILANAGTNNLNNQPNLGNLNPGPGFTLNTLPVPPVPLLHGGNPNTVDFPTAFPGFQFSAPQYPVVPPQTQNNSAGNGAGYLLNPLIRQVLPACLQLVSLAPTLRRTVVPARVTGPPMLSRKVLFTRLPELHPLCPFLLKVYMACKATTLATCTPSVRLRGVAQPNCLATLTILSLVTPHSSYLHKFCKLTRFSNPTTARHMPLDLKSPGTNLTCRT